MLKHIGGFTNQFSIALVYRLQIFSSVKKIASYLMNIAKQILEIPSRYFAIHNLLISCVKLLSIHCISPYGINNQFAFCMQNISIKRIEL